MKRIFTICTLITLALVLSLTAEVLGSSKSDSVSMGPGYTNEIYYSLKNGILKTGPRATWDIAFRTRKWSSSIITNDGSGVVLYTYPKSDTTGWASVDTTGLSGWTPMFNDPSDWENGAFGRNATGHPDYGWGKYNDVTHNVTGDSIFIIKLRDGSFRKLWIVRKYSAANIYKFRYANLDGSDGQEVSRDLNALSAVDFAGHSLQTHEAVDFEPVKSGWDILFTKYMSVQPNGTPYPVIGVLSNDSLGTMKMYPVPLAFSDFGAGTWDSTRSAIGWDWKVFDMGSFSYKIIDSTVYFLNPAKGDIYKLYFTGFGGTANGNINFELERMAGAGIANLNNNGLTVAIYPNPVKDRINLYISGLTGDALTLVLTDLSGRQLRADHHARLAGEPVYQMDVTGVQPGIYLVTVLNAATKTVSKVIITR